MKFPHVESVAADLPYFQLDKCLLLKVFAEHDSKLFCPRVSTPVYGILTVDIGIAPVKPAEFVVFRLSQFSEGGGLEE